MICRYEERGNDMGMIAKLLNDELSKLTSWFKVNELCFNIGKGHV